MSIQELKTAIENTGREVVHTENVGNVNSNWNEWRIKVFETDGDVGNSTGFHFYADSNESNIKFQGNKPDYLKTSTGEKSFREKLDETIQAKVNAGDIKYASYEGDGYGVNEDVNRARVLVVQSDGTEVTEVVGLDSNDNLTYV